MRSEKSSLVINALFKYFFALIFVILIIFLPAGSLKFWNGWLFIGVLFISMFFVLWYLLIKDPALLAKRLKTKEKEKPQKIYLILSIIFLPGTFIIPGLDFRYGWSHVPLTLVIISTILMMSGYLIFFTVMRQNSYASRVIEIQDEQKLIDTGLYSLVRHPLYLGAIILYGFAPLVLGSYYGLIAIAFFLISLTIRIRNEEKVLIKGLKGYDEYMKRVKYRLIPYLW